MNRLIVLMFFCLAGFAGPAAAQPAPPAGAGASSDFLATNARAPGVKTLPSGLQYKIVQSGPAGPSPKPGDIIKVHYEGALPSGKVFDSSIARGKPALMPLADMVPGWMEAIPMMHVGEECNGRPSKWWR